MDKKHYFGSGGDLFLFGERSLMAVAAIVSLLLQTISFFTTFDGAKAYFGATFACAPLLFALAVQSVVYFLENGLRRRVTFLKILALILAVSCSSYFSFVGIYNNINPPSRYLEKTYNSYAKELSALRDGLLGEDSGAYSAAVDEGVNYIISEYTMLTTEKATLEKLSEEINNAESENVHEMKPPRRDDYEEYEDYAEAYAAYLTAFSQGSTAEQQGKLQALLNKYGIDDISQISERSAEMTAEISLIEGTLLSYGGDNFYMAAEIMRSKAQSGDENTSAKISALYRSLSGKPFDIPEFISSADISLALPSYEDIAQDKSEGAVREKLISVIAAACDELKAAGCIVSEESYPFENIYTLPIYAVTSGSFGADALVSLILAVLVDLLSLIFAMIYVRSKSVLAVRNTEQAIVSDPMLFEQNILTAVRLGMSAEKDRNFSDRPDLDDVTDRLAEFVGCFRAVDAAADKGYTLAADRDSLGGFEALTAFLCQFGLARLMSSEEMFLLTGRESPETVLLKTKFILWFSEKCCADRKECINASEKAVTA